MQDYAFSNLDRFETSSLVTRMTTDVTVLQNAINGGLRPLVRSPMMLVMGLGLSFWMNARLALIFVVCAPVLALILCFVVCKVAPMYTRLQKAVDRLNNVVQEWLTGIRAVKAFVRGDYEEEKFQDVNQELMDTSQKTFHFAVLNLPAFQFTLYTATVLILWFGGDLLKEFYSEYWYFLHYSDSRDYLIFCCHGVASLLKIALLTNHCSLILIKRTIIHCALYTIHP